jgi:hypothetical protein
MAGILGSPAPVPYCSNSPFETYHRREFVARILRESEVTCRQTVPSITAAVCCCHLRKTERHVVHGIGAEGVIPVGLATPMSFLKVCARIADRFSEDW